ncbi:MAG: OmpA family protein [Desulfobacteraceae bacterium]
MKQSGMKILLMMVTAFFLSACAGKGPVTPIPDFYPETFTSGDYKSEVDNFLVVFDASSSMGENYQSNEKFLIAKEFVSRMNQTLPEMGQTCGLRSYGHDKAVSDKSTVLFYGMDDYSTSLYQSALDEISVPGGTSPLYKALEAAGQDLEDLDGTTALIVVTDAKNLKPKITEGARHLIDMFGSSLCIYPVMVGDDAAGAEQMKKMADIAGCGFFSKAQDSLTGPAMANFVQKTFLTRKPVKKAPAKPVKNDRDNDGVIDSLDQCPGTPSGVAVDSSGCPFDSDGDGVYDYEDKCPGTPAGARVTIQGCWAIGTPLFDFDKSVIKPAWFSELEKVARILKRNPGLDVILQGHTDNVGTAKYNMKLSMRRAKAVEQYLVNHGISSARLSCEAFGFSKPVASNSTDSGRALNRRVEITPVK